MLALTGALLFGALGLFFPSYLSAETIRILNLDLEVDSIVEVDPKTTRLTIEGQSWLIPSQLKDEYILAKYFESPERLSRIKVTDLVQGFSLALAEGDGDLAQSVLSAVLKYPGEPVAEPGFVDLLSSAPDLDILRRTVVATAENALQKDLMGALLYKLARSDVNWVRANAVTLIFFYNAPLKKRFETKFNGELKKGDFQEASSIVAVLGDLYGTEDDLYEKLRKREAKVQYVFNGLQNQDISTWPTFVSLVRNDPHLSEVLYDQVMERLHQAAATVLEQQDNASALLILANIDSSKRNDTTRRLVIEAISKLRPEEQPKLDPSVGSMLIQLARQTPEVKEAYLEQLSQQFSRHLSQGKPAEAEESFKRMLLLRPDPDSDNNSLRIDHARAYLREGMSDQAGAKISEVKPGANIIQWLKLFTYWIYAHPYLAILGIPALLALIVLSYLLWVEKKRVKRIPRPIRPAPEEGAFHKPEDEMPKFVITGLKEQLDPDYHEYVNCLKVFGLRPGADLAAIKNAYRNAVKEYHPDRNRNAQEMAAEVFIEMTRTYERLIELHTKQGKRPTT